MSEARDAEIRALRDMTACEGWRVFVEAVRDQWQGEKFVARMKVAARNNPNAMQESIKEVFAGREAVEGLLGWPESRRKKLEADAAAESATTPEVVRRA